MMRNWPGFWGKWGKDTWLPLAAHSLDVAVCFRRLAALPAIARALDRAAGMALSDAQRDRLAVLAMLHDLGKANRGFQRKVLDARAPQVGHVRELFALLCDEALAAAFLKAACLPELVGWFDDGEGLGLQRFLLAAWAHHGDLLPVEQLQGEARNRNWKRWWQDDEEIRPMQGVREVLAWARTSFPKAFSPDVPPLPGDRPELQHLFAGLVMLADWLGSSQTHFPLDPEAQPEPRRQQDEKAIRRLLAQIGLDARPFRRQPLPEDFRKRFGFAPRPLQAEAGRIRPEDRLWIAEAETGSGKTEAALHLFFTLFAEGRVDGLYFALPTRVAARNLYERVRDYVARLFPEDARPPVLLAVPGYAQVDGLALPDLHENRFFDDPAPDRLWAAEHPKRFLAAPIAVGTVDQALLGIVKTRHAHLRLGLLARHLLVVDEVHASDAYMSELIAALLGWHVRRLGGCAMLLSATLGSRARTRFLRAAGVPASTPAREEAEHTPYPAFWHGDTCVPIQAGGKRCVELELLPIPEGPPWGAGRWWLLLGGRSRDWERAQALADEEAQAEFAPALDRVGEALEKGARVLVVLNTVGRAVRFLRLAEQRGWTDAVFRVRGVRCPHHGRFAPADRLVLDRAVVERMGKGSPNGPVLLVGTQTLEQSLDIDADFLITDLCPADVLLQRLGRLHRHDRKRPPGLERPRAIVLAPRRPLLEGLDAKRGVASWLLGWGFGNTYPDLRVLEQTRRLIETEEYVCIPEDARRWVEAASHEASLAALHAEDVRWEEHGKAITGQGIAQGLSARHVLVELDKPMDEVRWREAGELVRVRLGVDSWQLPLAKPFMSPFGEKITEVVIPGWMMQGVSAAPDEMVLQAQPAEEGVRLTLTAPGGLTRHFVYDRFGLREGAP